MTSISSKSIPFIVIVISTALLGVDAFTEFEITETHIQLVAVILTPLGLGGLVNKGWNVYRDVKKVKPSG